STCSGRASSSWARSCRWAGCSVRSTPPSSICTRRRHDRSPIRSNPRWAAEETGPPGSRYDPIVVDPHRSPLDSRHRDLGAKMTGFGGWALPVACPSGMLAEHQACREAAVVFDVSHLGSLRLTGPDAFARLQGRLSNDLARIAPGRAQYTLLLDDDASVIDDL